MEKKSKRIKTDEFSYTLYEDPLGDRYTLNLEITPADSRNIPDGKDLNIQYTKSYTTTIGPLSKADLKALRKIIRKAIRDYEGNEHIQI